MTTRMIDCLSVEGMESYMFSHNLKKADLWALLDYCVEVHPHNHGKHNPFDIDEIEVLQSIENNTDPVSVTESEEEARRFVEGKCCELYQHGGLWFVRGVAAVGCTLTWDEEYEWFEVDDLGSYYAPIKPKEEEPEDEEE